MVDCDEVCSCRKSALDLELGEGSSHLGPDMSSAQHLLADGHKLGHRMIAIADELWFVSIRAA